MAADWETLGIAVGLTRRSIALLDSVGRAESAERLKNVVDDVIEANAWLRGQEMTSKGA